MNISFSTKLMKIHSYYLGGERGEVGRGRRERLTRLQKEDTNVTYLMERSCECKGEVAGSKTNANGYRIL